jgi:4-amino-4-deoxy-L-arabinose transferase-like glycosyltransferase
MQLDNRVAYGIAASMIIVMAALMIGAMQQETATVDETTIMGGGYAVVTWGSHIVAEQPPLAQLAAALPLLPMDLKIAEQTQALAERRIGYSWARRWGGGIRPVQELFPMGRQDWYFWPIPESQMYGQMFVYDGHNDAEAMLFRSRLVQVFLSVVIGLVIFFWSRSQAGNVAALTGLATWAFNVIALAYGHLVLTDVGGTLAIVCAVWMSSRLLQRPTRRNAIFTGLAASAGLLTKFTALTLAPVFVVLALFHWWRQPKPSRSLTPLWKVAPYGLLAGWALCLVVFLPHWSPPPPITGERVQQLGVPGWFVLLRPLLIPAEFFKGLALSLNLAGGGHEAFLCGEWRETGWWYYFPLAFLMKTPIPLLALIALGLGLFVRAVRQCSFEEAVPWIAAGMFLLLAMTSKLNIGVRHLLPMYALLGVGIATQLRRLPGKLRHLPTVLCGLLAVEALWVYPFFIQYFNQFVGGATNGYQYLLDSNYDWGQDGNRLKAYVAEQHLDHIYLDYFGTQLSIDYDRIPNTRVSARDARQITRGTLVVSASELMRPEWDWLRDQKQPVVRVGYTLFVYQFP